MISGIVTNEAYVCGEIVSEPIFSHNVCKVNIYAFSLKILRLSGRADILPVYMPETILKNHVIKQGHRICIRGQYRSHNVMEDNRGKLLLYIYALWIEPLARNDDTNRIALSGVICKLPGYRITPRGREIADMLIAVNRQKVHRSDYIPVIAWGMNARFLQDLKVGDKVSLYGRIQSRDYDKKLSNEIIVTKTAYEVSATCIQSSNETLSVTEWIRE